MFRRHFILRTIFGTISFGVGKTAISQEMVDELAPSAAALGYKKDARLVDRAKFIKYAPDQGCGSCALYQGRSGDSTGACPLFPAKRVSPFGWCSAWARSAGGRPMPLNPSSVQIPQSVEISKQMPIAPEKTSFTMEDSKIKCAEIGFIEKTEAFGKCVLQLSK